MEEENERDLTRGNLWSQIFVFSVPLILSNLLQVLFNLSDITVVGRFSGAAALGSVGSTANLVALFVGFLLGVGSAVNVLTARAIGMHSEKDVAETVHTAVCVCFGIGIAIMLAGLLLSGPVLRLMNTRADLMDGAVLYIRIYFCGMPAAALFNCGSGIYSAAGETRKPLLYLSLAGALNVVLNLFLVIAFGLGVAGVGIASAVSQILAAALIIRSLCREKGQLRLELKRLRLYPGKTGQILQLGLSSGFQAAIFQIANVCIQSGVNSFDTVTVEGAAAAANADNLVYDVMAAFYTACCSFIGQNYGAQNKKRMLSSYFISMFYAFAIALVMGVLLVTAGRHFLGIFTTDGEVIEAGMARLRIMGFSYCVSAFMDCTIAASRGLGRTFVPNIVVILGSCVFRLIWLVTVFAYFHTIPSLYLLYVFSWTLTAAGEMVYFAYIFRGCLRGDRVRGCL